MSLGWTPNADPAARDPFEQAAEVREMYEQGGALTHRRLPGEHRRRGTRRPRPPRPSQLRSGGRLAGAGVDIDSFLFGNGGFSAVSDFPTGIMRPP